MNHFLRSVGRTLLIQPTCRLCRNPLRSGRVDAEICPACLTRFKLRGGLQGHDPLPWHGLAQYDGAFRHLLLRMKRCPADRGLSALIRCLRATLPMVDAAVMVPIPSWKRHRANPLPGLIARGLGPVRADLLQRTRANTGQHHLGRKQRLLNLNGAFRADAGGTSVKLWLVDDILTTGGTALTAKQTLELAGHRVLGLVCLGRTPAIGLRR